MALHNRILIGLVAGAAVGVALNLLVGLTPPVEWVLRNMTEPLGRVWLNALIMVVIPLVLSTLALGIVGLGDVSRLGRIGLLTLVAFLALTTAGTLLGIGLVNLIQPGGGLDPALRDSL